MTKRKIISLPARSSVTQEALFPDDESPPPPPDRRRVSCFSYGSNVDEIQMRRRCPSALFLGRATLRRHAMAFAGHSLSRGGAVATVYACAKLDVPGALYSITRDDLARLDAFEGVPWTYERHTRWVVDHEGKRRRAEVYQLRREHFVLGMPSPAYLGQIVTAYHRLGIPRDSLSIAVTLAARVNVPRPPKSRP